MPFFLLEVRLKVLFACVAENRPGWYEKVENLALSIRRFGGSLRDAPLVACFVEGVEPAVEHRLRALGVDVRIVDRSPFPPAPTNKLRMLELDDDFEVLVALDCDVVVMGDISDWIDREAVRAMPEHSDPYPVDRWREMASACGTDEPPRSTVMTHSGLISYPYFNTGVVMIPQQWREPLRAAWSSSCQTYNRLAESDGLLSGLVFADQMAFSVAVHAARIPVSPLPVALNLFTTVSIHPSCRAEIRPPFILHYRNELNMEGFLYRSPHPGLDPLLHGLNCERASFLGIAYEGLENPPRVRQISRSLGRHDCYSSGPVLALRRSRAFREVSRAVRSLAQRR